MKKFIPITLLISSCCLIGVSLTNNTNDFIQAKADSLKAELLFSHGTPGVDYFYNYCPSILEESDGTRHIYYCTNKVAGNVTDYIGYRKGTLNNGVYIYSEESIVLSPTNDTWDSRHTCDPNVIKGSFSYNSHSYSYLMAYLGCITSDNSNNEIGLAVSDYPQGPWTKVDTLNPFKHFVPTENPDDWEWGYGQASMISIDKAGKVLFTYTAGQSTGTHLFAEKWDFSNLNSPSQIGALRQITENGLKKYDGSVDNVLNNADLAYDESTGRIYAIRDNHPDATKNPTVAKAAQIIYLEPHSSDTSIGGNLYKYGTWKILKNLSRSETGLARNHNCGLVRDEYGHINNSKTIEAIITGGEENQANDWWTALATYRLYSYKVSGDCLTNDYMLDVGGNITYNYTEDKDVPAFRMMPQDNDWSSGNAISIRIKNNTGVDTPIRIAFNCTNDSRNRVVENPNDSVYFYHLLSLDNSCTAYPYRSWDGDIWLKPNFDGYLIMNKDDQVVDTSYSNQGTFTWSSIFAIYFALETHYDSYANYDVGDIYTCNITNNNVTFIKPLLQFGLVSNSDTNNTLVLDYLGSGRINIARRNPFYIPAVELADLIANANPCTDLSGTYQSFISKYNALSSEVLLMDYFENVEIYDYQSGDSSHSNGLTNKLLTLTKYNYIISLYTNSGANPLHIFKEDNAMFIIISISLLSLSSFFFVSVILRKRRLHK